MKKLFLLVLVGILSCTKKLLPQVNDNGTVIDVQNDKWIAQKYAKKLGTVPEAIINQMLLYRFVNTWEEAFCVKEELRKERGESETYDPSWLYEKIIKDVYNHSLKLAKNLTNLQDRRTYLFLGKTFFSEGDVLYFSSYTINTENDPYFVKNKYDIVAQGLYLTNGYFLTCHNREKKLKILHINSPWKTDSLVTTWDKHFLAAERVQK